MKIPTNRLNNAFENHEKKVIPFMLGNDPDGETCLKIMHAMVKAGACAIELGYPFTDPMADGNIIAKAHSRVIENKHTLESTFTLIKKFRVTDNTTPIVLMGYLNPIYQMGINRFCQRSRQVGVDGVLIVDSPLDGVSHSHLLRCLHTNNLSCIPLLALNSLPSEIKKMTSEGSGYAYLVALHGVTGSSELNVPNLKKRYIIAKQASALPLAVGFGIHSKDIAKSIFCFADTIVIGSHIVSIIEKYPKNSERKISRFLKSILQ